ncbi:MAG: hypothetical protein EXX96DRAFT_624036 [Benjaminiella poitrasii]|nr:MAG: hypothetical protein EXX96DRAFT_624036 [Benjaminiella poitrasii]
MNNKRTRPNRNNATDSSDEESSDGSSITRCICGEAHNMGLMVQCDKCEIWQHCECMGLIQNELPDHYYCDQCKPENHQIIKTSSGRSKRLYHARLVNNNNSNIHHHEVQLPHNEINNSDFSSASASVTKKPNKRRRKMDEKLSHSPSPYAEEEKENSNTLEERSTRSKRHSVPLTDELPPPTRKKILQEKKFKNKSNTATSLQSSLEDFSTSSSSYYWNTIDGKPIRESSSPAKIKYPSSKMTFADMNKRTKQIMDYLSRIKSKELLDRKEKTTAILLPAMYENRDDFFIHGRPRSLSTSSSSSSLSSASTVPLLDDYTTSTCSSNNSPITPMTSTTYYIQKEDEQESSLEIIERISQEITKFKRKFGIVYQQYSSASLLSISNQQQPR